MRILVLLLAFVQLSFSQDLILTNVSLIPINTNTVISNATLVIKNGIISDIIVGKNKTVPKDGKIMDCKGLFVMPGLADMHAHFPDKESPIQLNEFLKLNLAAGVTSIRSMRGEESQLSLRDSINKQQKLAPKIYVSYVFPTKDSLFTKDSIEKHVREAKTKNYDFIKYLAGLTPANLEHLKASAQANKLSVTGHAYNRSLSQSMDAGFTSVEHFQPMLSTFYKDSLNFDKTIKRMKETNTAFCPTLSFYYVYAFLFSENELMNRAGMNFVSQSTKDKWLKEYKEALDGAKAQLKNDFESKYITVYKTRFADFNKVLRLLVDQNVNVLLSPDDCIFNVPGFSMFEEMRLYKQAGISNYKILKISTLNAAIYLKDEKNSGTIEIGKKADLILLSGNPIENLDNIKKVQGTILNGKYYAQQVILGNTY